MAFHLLSNALCALMILNVAARLPRTAAFALATSNIPASDPQYSGNGHKSTRVRSDISQAIREGPVPHNERSFVVNGWRWHTMSVIRDLNRFRGVIGGLQSNFKEKHKKSLEGQLKEEELLALQMQQIAQVVSCFNFVCGFNWKALIKVENKIFFPWLQELLPKSAEHLIKDYGTEHTYIKRCFKSLQERCAVYEAKLKDKGRS